MIKDLDRFGKYMHAKNIGYHYSGFNSELLFIHESKNNCNEKFIEKIKPSHIISIIYE